MARALKPGGVFKMSFPTGDNTPTPEADRASAHLGTGNNPRNPCSHPNRPGNRMTAVSAALDSFSFHSVE